MLVDVNIAFIEQVGVWKSTLACFVKCKVALKVKIE